MATFTFTPSNAQWGTDVVNNAINWELHVWESDYSGSEDDDGLVRLALVRVSLSSTR